jgi:molecular chaperone IbpA
MRTIDFSPMFRSTVGFDRLMQIADATLRANDSAPGYPPYNIEKLDDNSFRITLAVAGFAEGELDIALDNGTLTVAGKPAANEAEKQYLHRGIARRAFERRFELAEHIKVSGAKLDNGLLHVELAREVPEALKPRKIAIGDGAAKTVELEKRAA